MSDKTVTLRWGGKDPVSAEGRHFKNGDTIEVPERRAKALLAFPGWSQVEKVTKKAEEDSR